MRPVVGATAAAGALVLTATAAAASAGAPAPTPAYSQTRCGNTSDRTLLTFDDWSYKDPYRTTRIGAYLQSQGIRAAFFLINEQAEEHPDIVSTLRQQGHYVGNHTYSHQHLPRLTEDEAVAEIGNGVQSNLLRPPYGDFGERETAIADALGYRMCTWTVDTLDWEETDGGFRSIESIRATVREAPEEDKRGGVVLGHLDYHYPDAVPGIVADLTAEGYALCRNTGPVGATAPFPLDCG
ncbi:polysaccharide deacetylase family protein [Streptomyces pathocidini]|uniref:polysaccharide deacetylase family protein n=1 Tax=Streptomyces pathocidini TaxID=1650571 RepID=UPI0033D110AA